MSDKSKRVALIALPLIAFLAVFWLNLSEYMGLYDDLVGVVLVATAAISLPAQLGNEKIKFGLLMAISAALSAAAVLLFVFFKPAVSTKEASALLLSDGYVAIEIAEGQRTYPIEDGNFFVKDGYRYLCTTEDGKQEVVCVHPFSGERTVKQADTGK